MRVLLVSFEEELMALRYLASALKKAGHTVNIFVDPSLFNDSQIIVSKVLHSIFNVDYLFIKKLTEFDPDIVAFSVVTDYFINAINCCKIIRKFNRKNKKNIKTLFGGIHASSVPDKVIMHDEVDYICIGEGEEAIVELADRIDKGGNTKDIRNIWLKEGKKIIKNPVRPLVLDLDTLGFPDIEEYMKSFPPSNKYYATITSRGCPYQCSYCSNYVNKNIIYKNERRFLRRRSVKSVIKELKLVKEKYNPELIRFHDDDFVYDKEWLRMFVLQYKKKINIPYFCWANPNSVDKEVTELLKQSGCYEVQMGVQTIYPDTRKNILDRNMSNNKIIENIKLFKKSGIFLTIDNIFDIPGQSLKEAEMLVLFYLNNMPNRVFIYYLSYYPKLKINDIAYKMKIITKKDIDNIEDGKTSMFMYGTKYTKKNYIRLNIILHLTKFGVPKRFIEYLVKSGKYKLFPAISPKFSNFIYESSDLDFYSLRKSIKYRYYIKRKLIDILSARIFKYRI